MTNFPAVSNATLQKLCDKMTTCARFATGDAPAAAPNAFKDSQGRVVPANTGEVQIIIRTNPDGTSAFVKIEPIGTPAYSIEGQMDLATLASILA